MSKAGLFILIVALVIIALAYWFIPQPSWAAQGRQCGVASYYRYSGHRTADGEPFPTREPTAAHRTLPFGTMVKVIDQNTLRSVIVRINDRGPFVRGRVIDLSPTAAARLGSTLAPVCLEVLR